jgi:LysR family glycine cleavage system transcriptional activator
MPPTSHLKSLQALELAVRTGSLKAAADVLAITPAAVGQRVKALEDYLGLELLVRGRLGLQPSAALSGALPHLSAAFRELELASLRLDLQRGHEIHIAATPDFADLWLVPRLGAFKAEHPNMLFCVNGEGDAPMRLASADCEIEFSDRADGCDALFHDFLVPVASRENTVRLLALPEKDRLEGFPLLHLDFYKDDPAAPNWAQWILARGLNRSAPERGIRFRRIAQALDAVHASAGLAICGLALVAEQVVHGRLTLPFEATSGVWTRHAFRARFRSDALARPQMKHFRAWLLAEAALTEGRLSQFAAAPPAQPFDGHSGVS